MKGLVVSGCNRIGELVNLFFKIEKAYSHSADQTNFFPFFVRACKGLAIATKFFTNLL